MVKKKVIDKYWQSCEGTVEPGEDRASLPNFLIENNDRFFEYSFG
jgi:hypothetical protein